MRQGAERQHPALEDEQQAREPDEDLLAQGLRMTIDGEEEGRIRRTLETRIPGLLHKHETRYRMVSEGIMLIQGGCKPEEVVEKMRAFYTS